MLNLNMSDVMSVIESCKGYLIALAAVIVLGIVITVLCRKLKYPVRRLARAECWIAVILAVVILMNMICTGPLKGIVSLAASGNGEISEESTEEAFALCEKIAGEGIVLLEKNDILPMEPGNINVFGWASSNPCYGGTGSGGLSDKYEKTSLLTGLENAGVKPHTTKVACFLLPPLTRRFLFRRIGLPFHHTACTQYPAAYAASTACRLISVDKVQVLLLAAGGTFASAANLSLSGKDFNISRIKYRAPML